MRGANLSNSHHKSVVFFTAHKCASVYISRILRTLSEDAGAVHIDYESYFASTDVSRYDHFFDPRFQKGAFREQGYYYGAFRWFHPIPDMESYAALLVLRDPRDVLTSYYYSMAYSHQVISPDILLRREEAGRMGLDEYVLHIRHWLRRTYDSYCKELLGKPNVLFLTYEDMVKDFETWLYRLADHLSLDSNKPLVQKLVDEARFEVTRENVYSHKRQVRPGEHKRRLRPGTVQILTNEFHDVLDKLGYAASDWRKV